MSSLAEKHHEKIDDDATSARAVKAAKLATAPVCIMDGGMGHQLRRLGVEISGPIGSVAVSYTHLTLPTILLV